jgi:ArsR family transcriptional regulator
MKQSLVSHHLRVLKESGLVQAERKGPFVLYSIAKPEVHDLIALGAKIVRSNKPKSEQR